MRRLSGRIRGQFVRHKGKLVITIKHGRSTFTVRPENAEPVRDLLAKIDKRKIIKLDRPKGEAKHDSSKRDYPRFNPECMLTSDYITAYTALNHARLHLEPCAFKPAVNRTPAGLDPAVPEVFEETIE
jgi:hypothetical protein